MFDATKTWLRNFASLTENKAKHAADLAEAKAELVAKDVEHSKIVAELRADFETAVADLRNEINQLRGKIATEAEYCRSAVEYLEVSKRQVPNTFATLPTPPQA